MVFYKEFKKIIERKLNEVDSVESIIKKIGEHSQKGKIGFYPSGVPTGIILKEIKEKKPEILPRILGCFDKSEDATTEKGIQVYNLENLNDLKKNLSLLVVASNTFYTKEKKELEKLTNYDGEILRTSSFNISLPKNMNNKQILEKIDSVYELLSDEKSKSTYMIAWLSKMLNDESLTYLFESEKVIDENQEPLIYKDLNIAGLDHTCKKELQSEVYKMKHVFLEEGDVVFDIGAYKGDTALLFAHYIGKKGKVYAFEPICSNFEDILNNLSNNKQFDRIIIPINAGISNKPGTLKTVSSKVGAPWAYLSDYREGLEAKIITIDDFVDKNKINKVDFMKMDVEGFEENVILGSKKTIKHSNPKLAIALYHKTSDLINLPLLLNEIGNYQFYIRSKIEGAFGFTLFCKKNES